jgi:hypothetical protein
MKVDSSAGRHVGFQGMFFCQATGMQSDSSRLGSTDEISRQAGASMTKYLVIGNGVAGNAAAENIRKLDPEGVIAIFSRKTGPLLRARLPNTGRVKQSDSHHTSLKWYDQHRIDSISLLKITKIEAAQNPETVKGQRSLR